MILFTSLNQFLFIVQKRIKIYKIIIVRCLKNILSSYLLIYIYLKNESTLKKFNIEKRMSENKKV